MSLVTASSKFPQIASLGKSQHSKILPLAVGQQSVVRLRDQHLGCLVQVAFDWWGWVLLLFLTQQPSKSPSSVGQQLPVRLRDLHFGWVTQNDPLFSEIPPPDGLSHLWNVSMPWLNRPVRPYHRWISPSCVYTMTTTKESINTVKSTIGPSARRNDWGKWMQYGQICDFCWNDNINQFHLHIIKMSR